ncbi:ATP-grasp domain-containing protein [Amycolatopsis sp. YIM 10]|uniref:ATP-grasp domain-containing protein n=1 Tax=Amycolatopsis sp. YIM 10 TaxID=2653857 RepID=UPI0012903D8D|nr:ATP-grasp domain-containing protein [Amycolatopsis sp. YIM 10]QFU91055.1 Alanine-anticapsin ligase BacD [Amycolatopsis sp. YIM 10]
MSVRHALVVAGARDVTGVMKHLRPEVVITTMVALPRLRKVRHPADCERVIALSATAPEREWVALARAVHEVTPIDVIGAFGEFDQDRAAAIATGLGLRFHSPEVIRNVYDKAAMRERLRAAGVEDLPSATITSSDDLVRFARVQGFPLIVKPRSGTGSAGVVKVTDADGLALAGCADLVAEPFLDGEEISVEAFSENGVHRIVGITRKVIDGNFVELGHDVREATGADAPVREYVAAVLTALGLENGPSHTELILTAAGPKIVETHSRAGGDRIPQLLHAATGIDLVELAVRQVFGEQVLGTLDAKLAETGRRSWFGAIRYAVPPAARPLVAVEKRAEAQALPWVTACEVLQAPGVRLTVPIRSSTDRVAFCTAVAPDSGTAAEAAGRAVATLEIVVGGT